jgi:hypothetical protein
LAATLARAIASSPRPELARFRIALAAVHARGPADDCASLTQQGVVALVDGPCREARLRQAAIAELQRADLVAAAATLDAAGVPFLVLKGLPLARRLYGQSGGRFSGDVDLLVRPTALAAATRALVAAGHRHQPSSYTRGTVETVLAPAHGTTIEIHALLSTAERFDALAAALWRAPRRVELGRAEVAVPDDTTNLIYLCVHLARHLDAPRAVWVEDIRRFSVAPDARWSWAEVMADARTARAVAATALAIVFAQAALGTVGAGLPDALVAAAERALDPLRRRAWTWLAPQLLIDGGGGAVARAHSLLLGADWRDRLRLARAFVARRYFD